MEGYGVLQWRWSWLLQYSTGIVGLYLVCLFLLRTSRTKNEHLPPSPPAWPLFGHLLLLEKKYPHRSFQSISSRYGPLVYLRLGSKPSVIVSSPELAKVVLKTSDHIFASRPINLQGEVVFYNFRDLAFSPSNENTPKLRKLFVTELLTPKRIQQFKEVRRKEVLATVELMLKEGRNAVPVDVEHRVMELACNNMCRMLFGKRFYGKENLDSDSKNFLRLLEESNALGPFGLAEVFPWLRKFDLDGYERKLRETHVAFDKFLERELRGHREKNLISKRSGSLDFVDVLLKSQADSLKGSGEHTFCTSDDDMKASILDLLLGGTDTSATQILWTLAELMKNPLIYTKVQTELNSVVGTERLVDETDLVNLRYLQAVLKESMRLHPVTALIPHTATKATKVAGYDIPNKTTMWINIFAIMRDPNVWQDPLKFDPNRFLESTVDYKGMNFEYLPFGSGRRMCPGMNLGIVFSELTLAQVLQACDISLAGGKLPEEVDLEERFGIVTSVANFPRLLLRPRLPAVVYTNAGIDL